MSEVQHRPPARGRGATRGGRGGSGGRGVTRGARVNGNYNTSSSIEDQGEVGQLKKLYADKLKTIKEPFPDWTDEDIVFALQETDGDIELTVNRISEGLTAQWGEVKKKNKNDRSRSKVPETTTEPSPTVGRSSRGRSAHDAPRGNRGGRASDRASDRGGRPGRGRSGAAANGQRASGNDGWGNEGWGNDGWGKKDGHDDHAEENSDHQKLNSDQAGGGAVNSVPAPRAKPTNTWASLLRESVAPVVPKKASPPPPQQQSQPQPPETSVAPPPQPEEEPAESLHTPTESLPPPQPPTEPALPEMEEPPQPAEPEPEAVIPEPTDSPPEPEQPEVPEIKTEEPPAETIQPLTEQNLEKVEDVAPPAPTGAQASTINSVPAPVPTSTPSRTTAPQAPATPQVRHVGLSTPKIASARTASFTRRTLEQQEAVIMPCNLAIDRTTVQFGSLFNGTAIDDDDYDVEPTSIKPETVTQPPQSPAPQPVAALPPAPAQVQPPQQAQPVPVQQPVQPQVQEHIQPQVQQQQPVQPPHQPTHQDALPTPRQAPGLPAQPQVQAQVQQQQHHQQQHQQQHQHQQQQPPPQQPPLAPHSISNQQHMNPQLSSQFNRFGGIEQTQAAQKPYDTYQQHAPQQHTPQAQAAQLPQVAQSQQAQQAQQQSYAYPTHHQQQQQHHQQSHPTQAGLGGLSSMPDQYNNYYTSDLQRAGAPGFNYYTNPYSQPNQDTVASLPRAVSGMGTVAGETPNQLPTAPSQTASRFGQVGEQTSGHGTPSPALQPASQAPNPQQTAAHQQYSMQPYYHPGYYYMNQVFNYDTPYSGSNELNEGFSSYQQFYPSYQTPFAKQQGLYTQPHQNFQYSDHTTTPAALGGFGGPNTQGRDPAPGVNEYGRAAGNQTQQTHPQHSSANFGGLPNFLNSRGLPEQQQLVSGVGQQQVNQQGQADDTLKPFDTKPPTGPASNTGLPGQPRPGSATSGAANLPQQTTQPQGGMGYPHNLGHHLHGHQAHQQSQHSVAQGQGYYSMYGQYPNQYGASNTRQGATGWGGQYGAH